MIEIAGEYGNLVVRLDGDGIGEIAMRHGYCPLGQYLQRCHNTLCQEGRHHNTQRHAHHP